MATMGKEQIEGSYKSYEEIARGFSSPTLECTEIYLFTHSTKREPSHYCMVRNSAEREAMFSSPYVDDPRLVWSKDRGTIIPFPSK
jgi:hypothetical protein